MSEPSHLAIVLFERASDREGRLGSMTTVSRRTKTAKRRRVQAKCRRQVQVETQGIIDAGIIALVIQVIGQALVRGGDPTIGAREEPATGPGG